MTDETAARLAQIRAREQAATPGPWTWTPGMIQAPGDEIIMWPANIPLCDDDELDAAMRLGTCGQHAGDHAEDNLAFLAAAREDVPWLLNLVDQLRARIAAAEAQVAKHFQIASRYVGEGSTWAITAQALHAIDRALGGVQVAHDLRGLADGVIGFPPDADAEDMERFRVAWDEAAGPERALTLNVGNRTATFRTKPWPPEYDAVARETAEQTPHSEDTACSGD